MVGFAQVTFGAQHELAPAGSQSELLRLYVQEPFAGAMLCTKLLAQAERIASANRATVLWLTPWVHNQRALAFYARRGYIDCGLTCFTFEGESHMNRVFANDVNRSALAHQSRNSGVRPHSQLWKVCHDCQGIRRLTCRRSHV